MEQVKPESPTRHMLADQSSEEKSTCMIDYSYNSATDFSPKKKWVVKKEKAEKKPKTKKTKQEPEGKIEVQILEEGEIFDPDAFLDGLAQQWHPLPLSTPHTSTVPFRNPSLYERYFTKETNTQYGHWKYYKCPVQDCYVSCGVDNVEYYLESAECQLHNVYLAKPMHVMKCYCHRPLIMSKSQSEKNPRRLYLKCPKWQCGFFQWVDEEPGTKPKLGWKGVESKKGIRDPKSCSYFSKETFRGRSRMQKNGTHNERERAHMYEEVLRGIEIKT